MCDTCGCSSGQDEFTLHTLSKEEPHNHEHHHHANEHHDHIQANKKVIPVETDILAKNNLLAERNRGFFEAKKIIAINLVSSPGSGKTTLLERLILVLKTTHQIYVIEGDQQTMSDAKRIEATGVKVVQINTGSGCHLDAHMVNHAVKALEPEDNSILLIENVGNLVCPALFDLGEEKRIVIASTTEGEDKPLKYPNIFQSANLCVLNKIDLLPYLDFDLTVFKENLQKVKPGMPLIELSAKSGEGLTKLIEYLESLLVL